MMPTSTQPGARGTADRASRHLGIEGLVFAEQIALLHARSLVAQTTVVVNASIVTAVFWGLSPSAASVAWLATLCGIALLRVGAVRAYRRKVRAPGEARAWARVFTGCAALNGLGWGAAALIFHVPGSPAHDMFVAFVLGGMAAGAASSNASYTPAFAAFTLPALLPMTVRLAAARDPIHVAMAFMLALFGVAVAAISRTGGRAIENAIRLRLRNEALVARLVATQERLEDLNTRLENRVGERTADLLLAQDAARMGSWDLNLVTGEIVSSERCKALFGLGSDTVETYDGFLRAIHPEDCARIDGAVKDALASRTDYDVEMRVPLPDGSVRWVAAKGRAFYDASGLPQRMAGMALDITARKQAEEAFRDADRRRSEFLSILSHELRNPLAPIRNSIYVLDHVPGDSPAATSAREIIQRQTTHLARIVDDLLDVTRLSHGKIELERRRIDLRDVVLRTCEDHRSMFDNGHVALRHDLPVSPVWIDADATRISQVLGNLLQNAVKFTPAAGVVRVEIAIRDESAEMCVRDTGVGMRPEDIDHMFVPFAQADQGLARTQGGLGLGLSLVKGLVELHGGSVQARSDGPRRGSEFRVALPLATAPAVGPAAPRMASSAGGRLVLVIDDNVDTCESLSAALGLTGHRVRTASDGKAGIAAAHALKPDVVLCDVGLPDIDGYEVARTLRADETLRSTRLIALSGYARPEDKERAKKAGFDAHVAKPPKVEELNELLARGP